MHQKAASTNFHIRLKCVFVCVCVCVCAFTLSFTQRSQEDVSYLFPAPLNRCIMYEVKQPENLVEMLVGCWDMKTGESFANYFPVYGWMLFVTPALTEKLK